MISGFDAAIEGMYQGESKTVTIPCAQAYGPSKPELCELIDRSIIGKDVELLTLPNAGHGWDLEANYQTRYAFEKMIEYFDRHLKGDR